MNYLAVAKVGILVLADHIHTQYIGESGWSGQTWDWLMGTIGWSTSATLVDVINSIWNVASNAVTIVKQAVTNVMNAVKSGLEWIANSAISAIMTTIASVGNLVLSGLFNLIDEVIPNTAYSDTGGVKTIGTSENEVSISFSSQSSYLMMYLNGIGVQISNLLTLNPSYETLSLTNNQVLDISKIISINLPSIPLMILVNTLGNDPTTGVLKAMMALLAIEILTVTGELFIMDRIISSYGSETTEIKDIFELSSIFHLGMSFGILSVLLRERNLDFYIGETIDNPLVRILLYALGFGEAFGFASSDGLIQVDNIMEKLVKIIIMFNLGVYLGRLKAKILTSRVISPAEIASASEWDAIFSKLDLLKRLNPKARFTDQDSLNKRRRNQINIDNQYAQNKNNKMLSLAISLFLIHFVKSISFGLKTFDLI